MGAAKLHPEARLTMTTTPTTPTPQSTQKLTVADYLALDDAFEGRREFVDGEILEMPPESNLNAQISVFLLVTLAQLVPVPWLRHKDVELVVAGRVRMPDLVVLGEDLAAVLLASERNTITEAMPAHCWWWRSYRRERRMRIGTIATNGRNMPCGASQNIGSWTRCGRRWRCCGWWMGCMS